MKYWLTGQKKKKKDGEIKISIRKRNDLIDVEWQQIENDLRNLSDDCLRADLDGTIFAYD